jgi:dTDP-4-amino-4,6-dideoxygalactose transaminase
MSRYHDRPLGSIGHLAAVSFHETKNVISGEGGALLVNDERFAGRAEIIREKGTNRGSFFRGEVDKYTWVDVGSSYLPSEIVAAFLHAQLEQAEALTARRLAIWRAYHAAFAELEREGLVRRPYVPAACEHNAHMYYLLMPTAESRAALLAALKRLGIGAIFHYVPLHSSPAGRRFARVHGSLRVTDDVSERIVRLPLWLGLEEHLHEVIASVEQAVVDASRPTARLGSGPAG